ncbi:GIMAP4 [Symbiodinium sp. KB8]|nr:GIMAP4 [Symbiodinium sp. KB8]
MVHSPIAAALRRFRCAPWLLPSAAAVCWAFPKTRSLLTESIDKATGEQTSAESKNATAAAYSSKKLFRRDPCSVEPQRKVVVLIGMTGVGKSATANTLCGAKRAFETSSSVVSVTSAVRVRDYSFAGSRWRVIDTPGLGDTNKPYEVTKAELLQTFRYAPHGIAGFVVVVPKGRFTSEMEQHVRDALDIFGGEVAIRHTMIAVTRVQDAPEKLVDDIMRLPQEHTLRRLCELVGQRILPVENIKEPAVAVSRLLLHRGVDEVLEMNGEERYFPTAAAASSPSVPMSFAADDVFQSRCSTSWIQSEGTPRLVITCDFPKLGENGRRDLGNFVLRDVSTLGKGFRGFIDFRDAGVSGLRI